MLKVLIFIVVFCGSYYQFNKGEELLAIYIMVVLAAFFATLPYIISAKEEIIDAESSKDDSRSEKL